MKVKGYPELRRVGAAVVNVDKDAYRVARKRREAAKRIEKIESEMADMKTKLDTILEILKNGKA